MQSDNSINWKKQADYIDNILHLKHVSYKKRPLPPFTSKQGGIIRRIVSHPSVYNNFVIRLLFRVKNKLGIKFR
jgi:hypothetical protein